MRIERPRRRATLISLTSLIDVIFLLLLFFMLSTTFTRFTAFDLSAAATGEEAPPAEAVLIIRVMEDGALLVNGEPVAPAGIEAAIDRFTAQGAAHAVLQPRGDVDVERLVETLERLQKTPLRSVSLAR